MLAMFGLVLCRSYIPVTNVPVTKLTRLARGLQPQVKVANTVLAIARGFAIFLRSLVRQYYSAIGESGSLDALV